MDFIRLVSYSSRHRHRTSGASRVVSVTRELVAGVVADWCVYSLVFKNNTSVVLNQDHVNFACF